MTPVSCVMCTTSPRRDALMADALRAWWLQDHAARELIVVNDGAPLRSLHPAVTVLNVAPNQSLGARHNAGLEVAGGKWVAVWDDDDFSLPNRLSALLPLAQERDAALAKCTRLWLADERLRVRGTIPHPGNASAVIRADALRRAGGWPDTSWLYDVEVLCRLKVRGLKVATTPAALYVYRRHGANVSTAFNGESLDEKARYADPSGADAMNAYLDALRRVPVPPLVGPA